MRCQLSSTKCVQPSVRGSITAYQTVPFRPTTLNRNTFQSPYVVTGDFNDDGKRDDIATDYSAISANLFLGNGDGTFQPGSAMPPLAFGALAADFNQDGKLDLVYRATQPREVRKECSVEDRSYRIPNSSQRGPVPPMIPQSPNDDAPVYDGLKSMPADLTDKDWKSAFQLLDDLYRSIEDSEVAFTPFLNGLMRLFETGPVSLITYSMITTASTEYSAGIEKHAMADHSEYYFKISPWFQPNAAVERFFRGEVVTYEEAVPLGEYTKTEYFQDWGRANGVVHGIGTAIHANEELCTFVNLNRPLEAPRFEQGDIDLLQAMVPHIARAVRLQGQIELGKPALASFLVTAQLRLLFANPAAEALLSARGGFRLRRGVLRTPHESDQAELHRIVVSARMLGASDEGAWTARIRAAHSDLLYTVQASPSALGPGHTVLTVSPLQSPKELAPARLRVILRLTPAEIRLVCSLWQTANLVTSARDLQISINTAKRQLQNIFIKTGTSNQPSLFKLLAVLHPAR